MYAYIYLLDIQLIVLSNEFESKLNSVHCCWTEQKINCSCGVVFNFTAVLEDVICCAAKLFCVLKTHFSVMQNNLTATLTVH